MSEHVRLRNEAMAALARYEMQICGDQPFKTLSGGQQARLQILLLELSGATLLLLDEPTDNLDPSQRGSPARRSQRLRGHRGGGHARPLVRPLLRPLPGVRQRRIGL
jgi:ABC-type multidrug transport system ATPase subunit